MKLLYKILFLLSFSFSFGQSSTCANAAAMCSGNQGPFNNTTGVASFGSLGCLGSTPNPAWFYMQVGTSGNMNFQLSQIRTSNGAGIDVDFILWGPFNSLSGICNNLALYSPGYTGANNVVACSYSTAAIENFTIPNAVAGQFYMLLVTNFSGQAGTYTLNQTGGTGALSCDIVCGVRLGPDRILCGAATSVTLTANFLQAPAVPGSPVYSWFRNGILQYTTPTNSTTVNQSGTWRVSVTRPGCSDVATDEVEVQFIGAVPFNDIGPIVATPGACNPVIDLTSYQAAWVAPYDPASFVFVFYDQNANVITNPSSFTPTSSSSVFVEINAGPCNVVEEVNVIVSCVPPTCSINLTSPAGTNNQVLCLGTALNNIIYTTSGDATGVTVTGLPTGLTTNYASNNFTISGTPTQTGTFNYTVTTVGCSVNATQNGTITVFAVPAIPTITPISPTCSADGSSVISNYDSGVTYVFTPAGPSVAAGGEISGMVTGTSYTVLATNGTCSSTASSSFVNNMMIATPNVPTVSITAETCSSAGVATISNYDASVSYIFTPTGPTVNAVGLISGMVVGTSYVVSASNGVCTSANSSSFSVSAVLPTPSTPTINTVAPSCVVDGSSSISNYNGSLTYTFTPAGPSVGVGGAITGMITGTSYTVVSNNGTCSSLSSASFANAAQLSIPVTPTISVAAATCSSNEVATITNYVVGLTYVFTPSGPTVNASGVISGMTVGTNYVVAASNGSCSSADSSSFSINAMLAAPATPTITSVAATCLVAGSSSISNYNATFTYTFNPTGPTVGAGGVITGMTIGSPYTVTSFNGTCTSSASLPFSNANILSSPVAPTLSVVDPLICSGEIAIFQINGTANNVVTYSINGGTNQTVTLNASGSSTVEFESSTTNVVIELSNISNGNCSLALTDVATVTVESCSIPKGISPNGDGLNDNWDLSAYNIKKVEIFNRYGTKVYSKSNYENEWFGQSDSGNELPDGTYYFVIDFTDLETKTGWIYINRER
ncbi:gliding motility-associated C-terminal domain-containing protein [Flavobacterium proteolyticum]|uniref:Gliding motility-associated C-terminal domain-containing protein n=1 Tax=Flavobacterium proteolyticum TaxID=2911683 RepID=A0ABR9WT23_9FLAO|nr:gliding motility-associated C-terminal domain-containing protein [Flavobacterium proteolyticum]MBE9576161.1 gliding motility-associated C-terminal domain-containing protein [Flavobacterium proteolyticum]